MYLLDATLLLVASKAVLVHMLKYSKMQKLPQEVEEGNTEYKLKLVNPSKDRFLHLTTQLNWRLNEGNNTAYYMIGVADNGDCMGIRQTDLDTSLGVLFRMCQEVKAKMEVLSISQGSSPEYNIAKVLIQRTVEHTQKHLRVSVIGGMDSGKSTLIGVLTKGCLDNGDGLARMQVFKHQHEIENGKTSSISLRVLDVTEGKSTKYSTLDKQKGNYEMACSKLIMFSDLAGDERYLKTTAAGLTGQYPDYALLVVNSFVGIQSMTKEHYYIALALNIPTFIVMTNIDNCPENYIKSTSSDIIQFLEHEIRKAAVFISSPADAKVKAVALGNNNRLVPIIQVSSVTGIGLDLLQIFLQHLSSNQIWPSIDKNNTNYHIDDCFQIENVGTVITGIVKSGFVCINSELVLGPNKSGSFDKVVVNSIQVDHVDTQIIYAGQTGAICVKLADNINNAISVRKGMVLLHPSLEPKATLQFDAEVQILQNPFVMRKNYQAMIHVGSICQLAKVVQMKHADKKNRKAICRFEFVNKPEYVFPNLPLVFRELRANAVGRVLAAVDAEEKKKSPTLISPMFA